MKPTSIADQEFLDSRCISPLELLHPRAAIGNLMIIGSNCPARLLPEREIANREPVDLIILAPIAAECRLKGWLENSVQSINRFLAKDGVVYVLAPSYWRRKIKRNLQKQGLILETDTVHLPNWKASRFIVPLKPALIHYAFNQLLPTRLWKKNFILTLLHTPGVLKLVGNLHPWVGFAARRSDGGHLFNWLYQENGEGPQEWNAILHTSWRGERGSMAVLRFSSSAFPDQVVKLAWSKRVIFSKANEVQLIPRFGPEASAAGARVPEILSVYALGDRKVYSQTAISGRLAAAVLLERPGLFFELMGHIGKWLEAWHQLTKVSQRLERHWFDGELLSPASCLTPLLEEGAAYLDWLSERCEEMDTPLPLFSAHNDLSMWNILLDDQGQIGVVDWNGAREKCFPFTDLLYAVTDAAMIASGHKERVRAFLECFTRGGRYSSFVKQTLINLQTQLEIPKVALDFSFHVCFIGHAINEQNWLEPDEPQQFLEIVRYLSQKRDELREWITS